MTGSGSFWMASSGAASFYNGISTKSLKFTQHSTGSDNERLTRTMGTVDSVPYFVQADGKIHLGAAQLAFAEA